MTRRTKYAWVFLLYFAEGLPYGVFADVLPVYFRMQGISLTSIGLMNLFQLPWTAKVLWSPLVDRVGSLRRWIMAALLLLSAVHLGFAVYDGAPTQALLWVLLGTLTTASATQDIAIDGYFVRFMDREEQGFGNGLRVTAYRAALIASGGGAIMVAGLLSWKAIFVSLACTCALLAIGVAAAPSVGSAQHVPLRDWARAFWLWLNKPGALGVFAFILLYKLGDAAAVAMVRPFWVDRGMQPQEIGLILTTFGIAATVVGALSGGWLASRKGVYFSLWALGLVQAASNLGYAAVAWSDAGRLSLYAASLLENFAQGLATAALMAFLVRICDREHAATQYAVLTALFGLTRSLAGAASGFAAERLGFPSYFLLTFTLCFPAYLFLPWVKAWASAPHSQ